jgi:5-formyltetrahydrofolate cyclo-ligase
MVLADSIYQQLQSFAAFKQARSIAAYWAVRGEVPLHQVATQCKRTEQHYLLPVLSREKKLTFAPFQSGDTVRINRFGIPEPEVIQSPAAPEDLDLVLMPLLAFDRQGNRLGSGAGYYDRSFAFLRHQNRPSKPLLVGVAYAFQEVLSLQPEAWDVALDYICTDRELLACT